MGLSVFAAKDIYAQSGCNWLYGNCINMEFVPFSTPLPNGSYRLVGMFDGLEPGITVVNSESNYYYNDYWKALCNPDSPSPTTVYLYSYPANVLRGFAYITDDHCVGDSNTPVLVFATF